MSEIELQSKRLPSRAIGRERQVMLITAALAVFQFIAAYRALTLPDALAAQISLVPPLEFVAALAWGAIFSAATWRVAWYKSRNLRTGVYALVAFVVYSLARLFVFTRADYDQHRLRFLTVVTILVLIAGVVYLMRPVVRRAQSTERIHEWESED
jgi:prolipoprotein diacylglyceryltransferase